MSGSNDNKPKIFEDFQEVECNDCERYWLNQCDGAKITSKGAKTPCNSFLATRGVVIPQKLKCVERAIKSLWWGIALLSVFTIAAWVIIIWNM